MTKRQQRNVKQKPASGSDDRRNNSSDDEDDDVPLIQLKKRGTRSDQLDWKAMQEQCINCGHPITAADIDDGFAEELDHPWKQCTDAESCAEHAKKTNFTRLVLAQLPGCKSVRTTTASTSQDASSKTAGSSGDEKRVTGTKSSARQVPRAHGEEAASAIEKGQQQPCHTTTGGMVNSGGTDSAMPTKEFVSRQRTAAALAAQPLDLAAVVAARKEDTAEFQETLRSMEEEISKKMDNGVRVNPHLQEIRTKRKKRDEDDDTSGDDPEEDKSLALAIQRLAAAGQQPPVDVPGDAPK